ncbi:hypothetical protein BOX15_Mlig032672g1 [Macrostomum lignano]|uniref:EGF-like domain-containing protein n=1 Tax=Macrostomum lignano TaxID=282301 RepID=A0A267F285_9PLAT|nr:hypothetical protein BOX15_Mlig032672g1 [Macrostomum lignano]
MSGSFLVLFCLLPAALSQRCDLFPLIPLGLTDVHNGIPDDQITASSFMNAQTRASFGRLHYADGFLFFRNRVGAGAWIAGDQNTNQWLQIDLGERHVLTGVATQGRKGGREWVMDYLVQYADDDLPRNWLFYRDEYGSPYLFEGNIDDHGVAENRFSYPIVARYVRINPQRWHNLISMRAELYGCKLESYIASFTGSSRIELDLSHGVQTVNDRIQFRFRTQDTNGLILYASSDQTDHLAVELYQSKLRISINLGRTPSLSGVNEVFAGSLLDDNMWHDVLIVREQRMFNISVDRVKVWLELQTEYMHLNLNGAIYLGGMDVFTNKPGLLVRKNFTGCLENVWLNGLNLIRDARTTPDSDNAIEGFQTIGEVGSRCPLSSAVTDEIITLGSEDAFIKALRDAGSSLQTSLYFRTFQKDTVLIYHPLQTTNGVTDKFLALDIKENGNLELVVQLKDSVTKDISVVYTNLDPDATPDNFADGLWHYVDLYASRNSIKVTIDGTLYSTIQQLSLSFNTLTYIGWSPDRLSLINKKWKAFRGCIKQLSVQSRAVIYRELDPLNKQGTILNGTCAMRDRCMPNPCKRGAHCSQDWGEFYCTCPEGYSDSAVCHQSTHFTSCSEMQLLYPTISEKNATIDIDGSQILEPVHVNCIFRDGIVRTLVNHTARPDTSVNGYQLPGSFIFNVDYQTSTLSLAELVRRSVSCRQMINYKCRNTRLLSRPTLGGTNLANRAWSWWVSRRGQPRFYWGGSAPGIQRCDCGVTGTCQRGAVCNCDSFSEASVDLVEYQQDTGYFTYKEDLPVTQLRFGDTGSTADNKEGQFTLGPLECTGDNLFDNTVTFRKTDATIEMEPIYSETELDIRFLFKTTQTDAVFFQINGNRTGHFIEARLKRGREVQFSFNAGYGVLSISSVAFSSNPGESQVTVIYNDNEWHIVQFERNRKEFTLRVDQDETRRDREPSDQAFQFLKFNSPLFVGATQNFNEGYLGCLSNLMVNGVMQDIRGMVERGLVTYGVTAGCQPRCLDNPCLNRGECVEYYSHYYCECGLTPYRGYICGREVGATFKSSSDQISIDYSQKSAAKGINTVDEYIQVGFKTRSKLGILMQIRNPDIPENNPIEGPSESIIVRLNNAGGITVEINVGFRWHEVTTSGLDVDLANDQHHTVIVYRTKAGRQVNIKIDDYPVQFHDFSPILHETSDTRLDNPARIYIGRNSSMPAGFEGCIYRAQFNNFFPLKAAFQEPANERVAVSSGVKEDYCGNEEVLPIADPAEIRPYPTIPPNLSFVRPEEIQQRNQTIVVLVSISCLALLTLLFVACFMRNYTFERGDYETKEAGDGILDEDDADAALQRQGGALPAVRGKEWWL